MLTIEFVVIPNEYTKDRCLLNRIQHDIGDLLSSRVPSDLYTNISHSHNLVVCAISDNQIGIDVEMKKELHLEDFERDIFPEFIWRNVNSSVNPSNTFLKYWTNLESALKASKFGFNISFKEIQWDSEIEYISIKGKKWFVKSICINKDFLCSISSTYSIKTFKAINVKLENIK